MRLCDQASWRKRGEPSQAADDTPVTTSAEVEPLYPLISFVDRSGLAVKVHGHFIAAPSNDLRFKHDAFAWKQQHKPVGDGGSRSEPKSCPFIGQILN